MRGRGTIFGSADDASRSPMARDDEGWWRQRRTTHRRRGTQDTITQHMSSHDEKENKLVDKDNTWHND